MPDPQPKKWTREECDVIESVGLLDPRRYELIEGHIIPKLPKCLAQMRAQVLLSAWLSKIFVDLSVAQEPSIDVSPEDTPMNAPQPDAVVLTRSIREISTSIGPVDIRMVAEISSTTLGFDLGTKASLYARAGIPEYWILDIHGRRTIVHRDPVGVQFRSIMAYAEHEDVSCLAAPETRVRVADLF